MTKADRGPRYLAIALLAVLLSPAAGLAGPITVNGSPTVGAMPVMITAFANQAGTDVLPSGSTDYYVFTLFDTGATRVYFDTATATTLGVTNNMVTDIRINGLGAIDPVTLNAPIYAGQAQAEAQDIPVNTIQPPAITLIGGPVTNNVQAVIDYNTTITRGPYPVLGGQNISGPDITFYAANAPIGYNPEITLALQRFGTIDDAGEGQRYYMRDVSFIDGSSSVASPSTGPILNGYRFLYDTGTNVTLLTQSLATSLGLDYLGTPDFWATVGGVQLPGFYLDSITMTGTGGIYTVLNAPVVVTSSALGGSADAIIGSNLFSQERLWFDGPNATLGIGVEGVETVPDQPSTLILLGMGLAGALTGLRRRNWRGR